MHTFGIKGIDDLGKGYRQEKNLSWNSSQSRILWVPMSASNSMGISGDHLVKLMN